MDDTPKWSVSSLGTPATYEIVIRGFLDATWSSELADMGIRNAATADETPITILQGELVDQAALFGVLNRLYGLGFPVMSVACSLAKPSEPPPELPC